MYHRPEDLPPVKIWFFALCISVKSVMTENCYGYIFQTEAPILYKLFTVNRTDFFFTV